MKIIIVSLLFLLTFNNTSIGQAEASFFNLDFELNDNPKTLSNDWIKWGDYILSSDSEVMRTGKYAGLIASKENEGSFGSIAYKIPSKYDGKEITLEGYMKIEDVTYGHSGLLLRLDGKSGGLGFDNMQDQAIQGTKDWTKYSITLPYSIDVETIFVGGILTGKGKAWFDDFKVTIDGKNVQGMPFVEKPKTKAELDTEFDNGSLIELGEVDSDEVEKLYVLGKLWGFLKYHHPEIAKSNHNWDYELFRILKHLKSDDFGSQVHQWIVDLGEVSANAKMAVKDKETVSMVDYSWINTNMVLNKDTKQLLEKIRLCEKEKEQHYISTHAGVGNPSFDNEMPYKKMEFTDDGMRLLSLFRFWNMVEYFFPYKDVMDENWDDVLKSFIPRTVKDNDALSYKLTSLDLVGKIQDTHTNIWMQDEDLTNFHGQFGTPIEIKLIEKNWVVIKIFSMLDDPDSKIKIGDIVTHVNGNPIDEIVKEKIKYCPASNKPTQLRDVAKRLLRTNDMEIKLTLKNGSGSYTEEFSTILNEAINYWKSDTPSHKMLEGNIGYIYPASLERDEINDIMSTFESAKGLVIDLRCYPSDFLVFKLGKYLLPIKTPFAKFTRPLLDQPGTYFIDKPISNGSVNPDYYKGKVVILINEKTQSQAEYTTMALRTAPQATVIGSTTAGADGNISRIILPGEIRTMFSGIGVFYPDGSKTQRIGILPDLELHPTIAGVRAGKDELLEKAIEIITK